MLLHTYIQLPPVNQLMLILIMLTKLNVDILRKMKRFVHILPQLYKLEEL